jgi:hypothetical protein
MAEAAGPLCGAEPDRLHDPFLLIALSLRFVDGDT